MSDHRLCPTRRQTSGDPIVVKRKPVSLFFRLVPVNRLNTPENHQVLAANAIRPAENTAP